MPGFESKPQEVRDAIRKNDTEALSRMGKKGAEARARNLAEQKEFASETEKEFFITLYTERLTELFEEWRRLNDVRDMQGNEIAEEDIEEFIPLEELQKMEGDATQHASAVVEMRKRMRAR